MVVYVVIAWDNDKMKVAYAGTIFDVAYLTAEALLSEARVQVQTWTNGVLTEDLEDWNG